MYENAAGKGMSQQPQRESQVASALLGQEKALAALGSAIEGLDHRLAWVSLPTPPAAVEKQQPQLKAAVCPLAEQINAHTELVQQAVMYLSHIRERLEV